MKGTKSSQEDATARWEEMLTRGHGPLRVLRATFRHLPSEPRCKLCISPFGGIGGRVSATLGFRPSRMNPNLCDRCLEKMPAGGAETDIAVLFADVRGSTQLGEKLSPGEFAQALNDFYRLTTRVIIEHDGIIDKLIGDEVMALFFSGVSGPDYCEKAFRAGLALSKLYREPELAPLPAGVAVHAGRAFVGIVGSEGIVDFTAVGDAVNTAARLQAFAAPGQLVVSEPVLTLGAAVAEPGEDRSVQIRGRTEPMRIRIIGTA